MKLQQLITEAVVNGLVESEVTYDDYKSGTAFPGGSGGTGDTTSDNEVNYNLGTSADWQSDDVVAQINAAWAAGLDAWAAVDFKVVTGDVANGTIVSSEGTEDFRPYIDYTLDYPEPYYTTLNSEPYATQQHRTAAKIGFHVGSRTFDTNCQARIAYGKTTALGNTTSWVSLNGAVENQLVQVDVTGLDEGEFYYFSVEFDIDGDNVADFATEVSS